MPRDETPRRPVIKTLTIFPVKGMTKVEPSKKIPLEMSPEMSNCVVRQGLLQKRPGYSLYPAGMSSIGGAVCGIYSTQDDENNTHLIAVYTTGAAKFNGSTWSAMTGPALTGPSTSPFAFETSQNSIVFCQGVDKIQVHDISTSNTVYAVLNAGAPIARYLTRFVNRLIAAYTLEGGTTKPFRIRRPVSGDHTDWSGAGSGFTDLSEYPYHLRGIRKLQESMAVYTEKTISMANKTGQTLAPYRIDSVTDATGLYLERSLKTLPGRAGHIFLGNDDVYIFNGSQERSIGLLVRDLIFSALDPSKLRAGFAEVLTDTQEYLLFIANATATPDIVWVYNYGRDAWYPWTVAGPQCSTLHRVDDTITIDDLIGTIDENTWEIDSRTLLSAYPALLTGHSDGKVYRWGPEFPTDAGVAIPCLWSSRDLDATDIDPEAPPSEITVRNISVEYVETGVDCPLSFYFSEDGGSNWSGPYALTLDGGAGGGSRTASLNQQFTGKGRVRFKFLHNDDASSFRIISFRPELELGAPLIP